MAKVLVTKKTDIADQLAAIPCDLVEVTRGTDLQPAREGTEYEEKSDFEAGTNDLLDISKTVIAFANGEGGRLFLRRVRGDSRLLDSARLDGVVNRCVPQSTNGITSRATDDGGYEILVPASTGAPHVIEHVGNYQRGGTQRPAFYKGQIFVRHSSKSEPATADDVAVMIRRAVAR